MDYFKLNTKQLEQVDRMNETWLTDYKKENPTDSVTQCYAHATQKDGYYYLLRDNVTSLHITEYLGIVLEEEYAQTDPTDQQI